MPDSDRSENIPISALTGLRVLDFSHALAGPYCTMLLATYGAEICKVESRQGGDMGRGWGPPFQGGESSFFLGLNRGKLGVSIDLKQPEGIELCLKLVEQADVLLENFRPGTMERLGLGYSATSARNPRLIYCAISGYGQDGPSRDEAAMDVIVQSSSGLISVTGTTDGQQVRCGYGISDITAGMFSVIGILLALRARERTGRGQFVDVSMLDGMISAMSSNFSTFLGSGELPFPMGTAFPTVVPYQVIPAADRGVAIAVGSEKLWVAFTRAIGRPDLAEHKDFASNADRIRNRRELDRLLEESFARHTGEEWIPKLRAAGIPCSLVRRFDEVVNDPQTAVRQMFPELDHPVAGPHRVTGAPVKLSDTPPVIERPAPRLGEHTRTALMDWLGLDAAALDRLERQGVVFTGNCSDS
ncbi:MAG: CoA transferase [Acidobacteria bacterium]|nr:CoA transferase [Acidobacteriota bacterium]